MSLYNVCRTYMSYHILFEGAYFVLSYFTHIWDAYVAEKLFKKTRRMKHAYNEDKARLLNLKR